MGYKAHFFVLFGEIRPTVRTNFRLQIERLKFTRGTNFLLGEHFSLLGEHFSLLGGHALFLYHESAIIAKKRRQIIDA